MSVVEVRLPSLGDGVAQAVISQWLVREGDSVDEGSDLVEMSADTAVFHVPVPRRGRVREILADAGEVVGVGSVIILLETE